MARLLFSAIGFCIAVPAFAQPRLDLYGDPLPAGATARLGTLQLRHPLADHVMFTSDGKNLVTYGDEETIRFWDAATGKLLHKYRRPYLISSFDTVSPDGRLFLTESGGGVPEIWDLRAERLLRRLALKDVSMFSAGAFSAEGKYVAIADDTPREYRVRVWDVATGEHRVVGMHEGHVSALLFAPDGKGLISTSSEEGIVCRWKIPGGEEAWRIKGEYDRLALSADGRTLAGWRPGASNLPPGIWDATTGKPLDLPAKPEPKPYYGIVVSPDGKTLLLRGHDGLEVWDATDGRIVAKRPDAHAAAFAPNGQSYATILGLVQRWELKTGKAYFADGKACGHTAPVQQLVWSPDGKSVVTGSWFRWNEISKWNASTGEVLRTWDYEANTLGFTRDGIELIFAGPRFRFGFRNPTTGKVSGSYVNLNPGPFSDHHLSAFALSPDGSRLVATHLSDGQGKRTILVSTFNLLTGERLKTWDTGLTYLFARSLLSPDARFVAGEGRVFESLTGRELSSIETIEGRSPSDPVAFSPDGSLIAGGFRRRVKTGKTSSQDRTENVTVWDRATGRVIRRLPTGPAGKCAFLPDGRTLITASPDGLRGWDILTGKETFSHKAHDRGSAWSGDSFALCLAVSPDGRKIATGHLDTTALIWEVPEPVKSEPKPLTDTERDALWSELIGTDAVKAYAARCRLAEAPAQTLPMLGERLHAVKECTAADLKPLLADLDAGQFRVREAASKRLAEMGDAAEPALRAALRGNLTPEVRQRIEGLLAALDWKIAPRSEDLRAIRAVAVLEDIGSAEAKKIIEMLAGGAERARVTTEARAALERMRARH